MGVLACVFSFSQSNLFFDNVVSGLYGFCSTLLLRIGHAMYVEKGDIYLVFNMQIALCFFVQTNMQMYWTVYTLKTNLFD